MNIISVVVGIMILFVSLRAGSDSDPVEYDYNYARNLMRLERIITCDANKKPSEAIKLVEALGGISVLSSSSANYVDYHLPNPLKILGIPVTSFSIHRFPAHKLSAYDEYSTVLRGEPLAIIASRGDMLPVHKGEYVKKIQGRYLVLRSEAGLDTLTCITYHKQPWWQRLHKLLL